VVSLWWLVTKQYNPVDGHYHHFAAVIWQFRRSRQSQPVWDFLFMSVSNHCSTSFAIQILATYFFRPHGCFWPRWPVGSTSSTGFLISVLIIALKHTTDRHTRRTDGHQFRWIPTLWWRDITSVSALGRTVDNNQMPPSGGSVWVSGLLRWDRQTDRQAEAMNATSVKKRWHHSSHFIACDFIYILVHSIRAQWSDQPSLPWLRPIRTKYIALSCFNAFCYWVKLGQKFVTVQFNLSSVHFSSLLSPGRGAKYCHEYVCLSVVCLSAR